MGFFEVWILSLFDFSMMTLIYQNLFNQRLRIVKTSIAILLGALVVAMISYYSPIEIISQISNLLFVFVFFMVTFKYKLKDISKFVTAYVITTIICYTIQFLMIVVFTTMVKTFEVNFQNGFILQLGALVTIFLLMRVLKINALYNYIVYRNIWLKVLLINLMIIFVGMSFFWYINPKEIIEGALYVMVIAAISITISAKMINDSLVDQKQKEKLQIYETYLPIIDSLIDDMKMKQHDYNNQLQIINTIKKKNLDQSLSDYIDDVFKPQDETKLIFLDNKILMALLFSKKHEAEALGIDVSVEIENYSILSQYTDYDLVEMYGILLTNAIEALELEKEKKLRIKLLSQNNMHVFMVSNYIQKMDPNMIHKMFDYSVSTKGESRGIGLYKLNQLLKKNSGQSSVYYDDQNMLTIEIHHF